MSVLTAVVVDDEPHARSKIRRFLSEDARIRVVAEASDGLEALEVLERERPHLVFLDIQMPGMDGFEVLQQLDPSVQPQVIFVTAHDDHALRAFEVHALDYLLKPVDPDRFTETLQRAVDAHERGTEAPLPAALRATLAERTPIERFLVRSRGRMVLVPVAQVEWIGAAGNYVEVHVGDAVHLVRGTLADVEDRLPAGCFARIHRSTIIRLDRIKELQPWSHGDWMVILDSGVELKLSRRYRERLVGLFGP
ncbi:MAG: LytTR family DNA-binding domain-containing protein [Gemmatimonadota bacterium]